MKKILAIVLLYVTIASVANAQHSAGGTPLGFKFLSNWNEAPVAEMPLLDTTRLKIESFAKAATNENKILTFGYAHTTHLTPENSGRWLTFTNGSRVWLMRIHSPGAKSISLGFTNMSLTDGARLFIYNKSHSILLGAFTSKQPYVDSVLATEQVTGDELLIEYEEPYPLSGRIPFVLQRVSHDFLGVNENFKSFGFGQSGNCQVNINCPDGVPYWEIKKSVAAVLANGTEWCSGSLINTTNNSGIPYFLTAYHCWVARPTVSNWVFRFNWESPNCPNPTSSPTPQSISGATLISKWDKSDFCLLRLSSAPPASYGVIYGGWDKRNVAPQRTVCISHPNVDIKKIAISPFASRDTLFLQGHDFWRGGRWTVACPEDGSSGSPSYNQNNKIVGQLRSGPSACGNSQDKMFDIFGRLSSSWGGDGTPAGRLKDWLDPNGTNVDTVELYDPNRLIYDAAITQINSPVASLCNTVQRPEVIIKNTGVNTFTSLIISCIVDNGTPIDFSWTGSLSPNSTTSVTLMPITFTGGNHTLQVRVSKPNNEPDNVATNNSQTTTFFINSSNPLSLPVVQDFEDSTFPNNSRWTIVEPNVGTYSWKRVDTVAASGRGSLRKDNFNQNDFGKLDHLYSPLLNFAAVANYKLSFKIAYAKFANANPDSLLVYVSKDCANTWQRVYAKSGDLLASAPQTNFPFFPATTQWRTDSIDLSSYSNSPFLQIRFTNVSGWGNHLYLDDINIEQRNALPVADFLASDTFCTGTTLALNNTTVGGNTYNWNMNGATPPASSQSNPTISFPATGNYTVALTASNVYGSQSKTKQITVVNPPVPTITQASGTLTTAPYHTYQWYKDGVIIPGAISQTYHFTENGRYVVKVATAYGCDGQSQEFVITNVDVNEHFLENTISIAPNPARSFITIQDKKPGGGGVNIQLYNMLGQMVVNENMINSATQTIYLTGLSSGIYTIRVTKGAYFLNSKLIVQ